MSTLSTSRERSPGNDLNNKLIPDPYQLKVCPQWVVWRYGRERACNKYEKVPTDPITGKRAKTNAPGTWTTISEAKAVLLEKRGYDGVGFMLSRDDPYSVIDLDDCRNPETGEVEAWALEIVRRFASLTLVSPSGTGLHIWLRGTLLHLLPGERGGFKRRGIEAYSAKHFMTWTGNVYSGDIIEERQGELSEMYQELHPEPEPSSEVELQPAIKPSVATLTNDELLARARRGEALGAKFSALYDRGDLGYSGGDRSKADLDLTRMLAFYTGNDTERIETLFSKSVLGQRDKWKYRPDYRRSTIDHAIKRTTKIYDPENYTPRETKTRDRLRECMPYAVFRHPWREITGRATSAATDYFGYRAVLRLAHKANSDEIDVSIREYAEEAGIGSNKTAAKSLARLVDSHGLLEKVGNGNSCSAARYRIKGVPKVKHTKIGGQLHSFNPPCVNNGYVPLLGSHMIRNTSPERSANSPVKSVGKAAAWILDIIHAASRLLSGPVPIEFIEEKTGIRRNHLRERSLKQLLGAGLIEEVGGGYITPQDVGQRLKRELNVSGCVAALNAQRKRNDLQRRIQEVKRLAFLGHHPERIAAETGYTLSEVLDILQDPDRALIPEGTDLSSEEKPRCTKARNVESSSEICASTLSVQQEVKRVRNLPPISVDTITRHGTDCSCWLCEKDNPEGVKAEALVIAGSAA